MLKLNKFCHAISRKRSLSKCKSLDTKLDRCLSTYQLIFYGISSMIGAGIYVLTGHIIKDRTGPATNLSFLFSGLASIFTGLCYCEFATLIPKAGSCYTYTYIMIGELPAFIIGWTIILEFIITLSSVAKGFSGAMNLLCDKAIQNFTLKFMPLASSSDVWDSSVDLVAVLLLVVLFLVTLTGANISMNINAVLAVLQICFLIIIIISCFIYGSNQNYVADGGYLPFGYSSIVQGAGIAIFAFSGFECLANSAEETKEPRKSIPIALLTSLGIVIILYIFTSTGLSYMVPRLQIDQKAPFIAAFNNRNLIPFKWIAGVGTLLATGATKLTVIYVIPRIVYAMSEDGLLFKFLGIIDQRTKIPIVGLTIGLVISVILAMFVKLEVLADVTSMGIILSYIVIGFNLMILRYLYIEKEETNVVYSTKLKMRVLIHHYFTHRNAFIIILSCLSFSIFSAGLSVRFIYQTSQVIGITCTVIFLTVATFSTILLSFYEPFTSSDSFMTPLMPLTPIITMTLNICLLINLPRNTWLQFLIWVSLGLIIYFSYGISNSTIAELPEEKLELINMEELDETSNNLFSVTENSNLGEQPEANKELIINENTEIEN